MKLHGNDDCVKLHVDDYDKQSSKLT